VDSRESKAARIHPPRPEALVPRQRFTTYARNRRNSYLVVNKTDGRERLPAKVLRPNASSRQTPCTISISSNHSSNEAETFVLESAEAKPKTPANIGEQLI